ncbi:amidase [Exophiala viscosa]|uniref:Amidase n=1 Tax=Exophiala viscosa TaxID=2486360 RepID=A0AAN6IEN1_9EURO|nr:amidase [Exophiala viscosa]
MTGYGKDYRSIAADKQRQRQDKIPEQWLIDAQKYDKATNLLQVPVTCGILNEVECQITSDYDATALLEKIQGEVWSVEQVTVAFCKRAAVAHQLTNCLTEIFFYEAIERARQLDRERRESPNGKALRPLHGLPISLKDSFHIVGQDTSTGLACFVNDPAEQNSALAALLLDLGAILYCKTNLPQTIMTGDSDNNVFGRTLNPHNTNLTAGGSTGGEGALIALRGSLLGVGTDIAGSIRIPSLCNGLYGFRGSVGVVPHGGVRDLAVPGTDGVRSTAGPMATSIRDCQLLMKAIMESETWRYDSTVVSVPWRGLRVREKLRIGLVEDNGIDTPSPPIRRSFNEAARLLQGINEIEVIPLSLPGLGDIYQDLVRYMAPLGTEHYSELFNRTGEPAIPSLDTIGLMSVEGTTLKGFFEMNARRQEAAKKYLQLFCDNRIDAILMPVAAHTAVPWDKWANATYTGLWNYLDYPAVVIPVDKVQDTDLADDVVHAKYGPGDAELYKLYTGPELYSDAPTAVQVVGYRQMDEALLNTAIFLDSIINGQKQ